ncbi:MAG: hypothetical protein HFI75_10450 [Lachnospiraceae bacterium]|nr:hypothetical protein [Lachnospiraceae bacterium]
MAKEALIKNLNIAIAEKGITPMRTLSGAYFCMCRRESQKRTLELYSKDFAMEFRLFYSERFQVSPHQIDMSKVIDYLEMECYKNTLDYELCHRVYNDNNQCIAYDLNKDDETAVWIEAGECCLVQIEDVLFCRSNTFQNQIQPDFNVKPKELFRFIKKHFNVESRDEVRMLALYLVSCFWGLNINHPILVLIGEKGSSKSTSLRKLERIIDPKTSDLCGIPKGADGLELRLSNSYFCTLDNLSAISRSMSDLLARAATGGSVTKRALYQNTEEIVLNIKAILAVNSVSMVVRESDLLDRSLLINLARVQPEEMKTEEEIWKEFEDDLPQILGCCFQTLALALNDKETMEETKLIRMADFHTVCIRIGKALGLTKEKVSELLWNNQRKVNQQTLDEDVVAQCIIAMMGRQKSYKGSVSELLAELKEIAEENSVSPNYLPKAPNQLSKRLNKIKSNLQQMHGLEYEIEMLEHLRKYELQRKDRKSKAYE